TGQRHDCSRSCGRVTAHITLFACCRLTPMSPLMSPNGQAQVVRRSLSELKRLPRPLYGQVESLPNRALTYQHSHPWVQLSYATQGVLEVQTRAGRFIA